MTKYTMVLEQAMQGRELLQAKYQVKKAERDRETQELKDFLESKFGRTLDNGLMAKQLVDQSICRIKLKARVEKESRDKGMSLEWVFRQIGVNRSSIRTFMKGKTQLGSDKAKKLRKYFGDCILRDDYDPEIHVDIDKNKKRLDQRIDRQKLNEAIKAMKQDTGLSSQKLSVKLNLGKDRIHNILNRPQSGFRTRVADDLIRIFGPGILKDAS